MKKRWFPMGVLIALLVLSSCGPKALPAKEDPKSYYAEPLSVDAKIVSIESLCFREGRLLMLCRLEGEDRKSVLSLDEAGRDLQIMDNGSGEITHFAAGQQGLFFTASRGADGAVAIVRSSPDGGSHKSADFTLPEIPKGMALSLQDIAADRDNNVYAAWVLWNRASMEVGACGVTVWSAGLEPLFTIESDKNINGLVSDGEGFVYADLEGEALRRIDAGSHAWGAALSIRGSSGVYPRASGGFYVDTGGVLYVLDPAENTYTEVLSWEELGFLPHSTGKIADSGEALYFTAGEKLCVLKEGVSQELPPESRTVLRLVTDPTSAYRAALMVQEFNSVSKDYKIELTECGSEEDVLTLALEISAGKIPDLFMFGNKSHGMSPLPAQLYAAKGLLIDLYPLLDGDDELSRASFWPNLLETAEAGGALYEMPVSFMIEGVVGRTEDVGARMGWTVADMKAAIAKAPNMKYPFGPTMLQRTILKYLLAYNYETFVDWSGGTCNFDSKEFIELLELAKMQPAEFDNTEKLEPELIADGEQLVHPFYLPLGNYLQQYPQILGADNITYIGYPTPTGIGNSATYNLSFAISSGCQYVDAAWAFLRPLITQDCGFPLSVNKNAAEKYFSAVESHEQPGRLGYGRSQSNSYEVTLDYSSEQDIETLRALIESLDRVMRYDRYIGAIISEDAAAYFAGDKSAAEAARIIQARVKIYIAENKY